MTSSVDELARVEDRNFSPLILAWSKPGDVRIENGFIVHSAWSIPQDRNPKRPLEPLSSFLNLDGAPESQIEAWALRIGLSRIS